MHLVIADEGRGPFAQDANTIKGYSTLSDLQGTGRSAGVSFYVLTNALSLTDRGLRSNVFLTAAFRPANGEDATLLQRTLNLTNEQTAYLERMPRGEAIIKLGDAPAFLTTFDELPDVFDANAYEHARRRTHALLNALRRTPSVPPPTITAAATEGMTGQPATAQPSPSASHASAAPLLKPIALNEHANAVLMHAAKTGLVLTTEAFRDLELHPQAGTRAKKQLLDLALIEEERITIRRGRGGTAVAIRPTAAGYERARVKRHGTRGGDSIQHEYLVRALAVRIANARIEARAGSKACDLLIPYNSAHHEQLARTLDITPRDSDLIAIEVEVSDPKRTAIRNIVRNTDAGIAHTIIATVTPLRRQVPGAVIVDVFALLEAL